MNRFRLTAAALSAVCAATLAFMTGSAAGYNAAPAATSGIDGPPSPDVPRDGADPNAAVISQQAYSTVYEGKPGEIAGNGFADAVDGLDADGKPSRTVLLSWQANEDVAAANSERTLIRSVDRGYSFPSGHAEGISGFYRKLRDGDILGVEFIPAKVIDSHRVMLLQKRSKDGGRTWKSEYATFTTDKTFNSAAFNRGIRVHRDILEDPEGNLLLTYYTAYQGESAGTAELAISRDKGRSWQRYATIFPPMGNRSFNEAGITWAVNGELVAVSRSHVGSTLSQMYTARSSDRGKTWSTAVPVSITTASGEPAPQTGVMPVLDLLPNGIMTFTFGRPDNWVAISPDGLGRSFEQAQVTYQNFPDQDTGVFQRWHGSSGNGAHAVVNANRILQVGDNCAPSWGCPATDSGFQVDGKYRIWKKFIDVDGPGVGRIDLLSKYTNGAISVDTDMTATNSHLPEMRPAGAIDGSTDWASSAVRKDDATGTYTLTLDHTYTLSKAGLSLHPGLPSSAVVEVSTDRTQWTKVVDTGALTSYALSYFPIDRVPARYVRITVHGPNGDDAGGAFLNEVELYSTIDSFENDAVGYVPRGYTNAIGATVTDENTDGDGHALRLADAWKDTVAQATWASNPASTQDLQFRFQSMGYARTLQFITNGVTDAGAKVPAFQVAMQPDGRLAYYDSATRVWTKITGADQAIPQKEWHAIEVKANLTGAQVFLDGASVGTVPPTTAGVTALVGHTFTTTGTASTYDNFVIDDVEQANNPE